MSFLRLEGARVVPGVGPDNARVAVVGEAPGSHENQQLKPFVGPAGGVLENCLHAAGLIRSEVYLTNVVKTQPPRNDIAPFFNVKTGEFTEDGQGWVHELHRELSSLNPNVIVAAGQTAMAALTRNRGKRAKIMKFRGYVWESVGLDRTIPVIPTIHPSASLRGQYIYRHIISADLRKARELQNEKELKRPERTLIYNWSTVTEILEWLEYYANQPLVCLDIEVLNYEVSCIGLSSDPSVAISVPFDARWTEWDELLLWRALQKVLANPLSLKVVQNGIFDIHFLLTRCRLEVKGPVHDAMIAHHVMYPELRKGLDFLGSIYCGTQEYWKDAVKFDNIKEDS